MLLISGCGSTERDLENEMELERIKAEIYEEAYKEGYNDAVGTVVSSMPWFMIDMEELEDSLYEIFGDGEYAEEIRDQIMTYCDIYESEDFIVEYSKDEMDYGY